MIFHIYHWYRADLKKEKPHVNTFKHKFTRKTIEGKWEEFEGDAVEVDQMMVTDFICDEVRGPVIIQPPTEHFPHWTICVTDKSGRFSQK